MSCVFVSEIMSLTAMSLFSLGTVFPQRRKSKLLLTLRPLCENAGIKNGFAHNDEMWRYGLLMLQGIAMNPKVPDPRLNTAQCVVLGHEGDDKQPIIYPVKWHSRECWIPVSSVFVANAICWLGIKSVCNTKREMQYIKTFKCSATIFFMLSIPLFICEIAVLAQASYMSCPINIIHCALYFIFLIAGILFICYYPQSMKYRKKIAVILPATCYQMVHHLLWVLCGGIMAEPSWAIPLFLCECFAILALVSGIFIFFGLHKNKAFSRSHAICSIFTLEVFVFTVVLSFSDTGYVSTENVLQIIMVTMLLWLIKHSGLEAALIQMNSKSQT